MPNRKIHMGKRGGLYYMKAGKKVYIKSKKVYIKKGGG